MKQPTARTVSQLRGRADDRAEAPAVRNGGVWNRRIRYIGQLSCATGCSFHSPGLGHVLSGVAAILVMHDSAN